MSALSHRSDARRNRERILDAAHTILTAAENLDAVTMQSIARQAGVGQGTLYRHFADREDLVLAVYQADVERLLAAAARHRARRGPREALRRWLLDLAEYGRVKRGIAQLVIAAATRRAVANRWRPLVLDALQSILDDGTKAGELRADIDAEDLWTLLAFLWYEPLPPARVRRLIAVLLDGLTAPSTDTA